MVFLCPNKGRNSLLQVLAYSFGDAHKKKYRISTIRKIKTSIQKYQSMLLIWHLTTLQDPFEREVSGPGKVHRTRSPVSQMWQCSFILLLCWHPGLSSR